MFYDTVQWPQTVPFPFSQVDQAAFGGLVQTFFQLFSWGRNEETRVVLQAMIQWQPLLPTTPISWA